VILTQTTAIGLRYHPCERAVLQREVVTRDTSFGRIPVKKIMDPDKKIRFMPEYEACKKAALGKALPLKDVYARVMAEVNPLDRG
jgi:uncharacterized protein (DUF111 family)